MIMQLMRLKVSLKTANPTMDVNTVNQKAASKSTKDALDGQQNLQRAKTEATNAIHIQVI